MPPARGRIWRPATGAQPPNTCSHKLVSTLQSQGSDAVPFQLSSDIPYPHDSVGRVWKPTLSSHSPSTHACESVLSLECKGVGTVRPMCKRWQRHASSKAAAFEESGTAVSSCCVDQHESKQSQGNIESRHSQCFEVPDSAHGCDSAMCSHVCEDKEIWKQSSAGSVCYTIGHPDVPHASNEDNEFSNAKVSSRISSQSNSVTYQHAEPTAQSSEIVSLSLGSFSSENLTSNDIASTSNLLANILSDEICVAGFCAGLRSAGFLQIGGSLFLSSCHGVTLEFSGDRIILNIDAQPSLTVDDIPSMVILPTDGEHVATVARQFGSRLLTWCEDGFPHVSATAGSMIQEGFATVNISRQLDLEMLPSISDLGGDAHRALSIFTYGRVTTQHPPQADKHFCVDHKGIRYRLSGRQAAKLTGLDELIQARVCRCSLFQEWVREVVHEVEARGFSSIAVFCWKGRHRSVAAAEILRLRFYPNADIQHLSL